MQLTDTQTAIAAIIRVLALGTLLSSAEFLWHHDLLKSSGLMSWEIGRLRQPWLVKGPVAVCINHALSYPHVLWLLVIRVLLAILMLFGPARLITKLWVVLLSTLLCWLFVLRTSYGQDGADQMSYIIYTGLAIASIAGTDVGRAAFLWFVALQACLAYCVAGLAKAGAKGWRDGSYLIGVCETRIYGHAGFAEYLSRRPQLAKVLSCTLIVWESSFPLVLLIPRSLALGVLGAGVLFHLTNGYFMGLNTFIWSFAATYPAIIYCVQTRGW
jgi:uncharacterized membrane protein (DUF485 family)